MIGLVLLGVTVVALGFALWNVFVAVMYQLATEKYWEATAAFRGGDLAGGRVLMTIGDRRKARADVLNPFSRWTNK